MDKLLDILKSAGFLMTISRKERRRIRRFFVTCCRGAITFLRMERSITGSARCGWNYMRTRRI